jgi:hypothetical protein
LASLSAETKCKTKTRIVSEDLSTREALFYNHNQAHRYPGCMERRIQAQISVKCAGRVAPSTPQFRALPLPEVQHCATTPNVSFQGMFGRC